MSATCQPAAMRWPSAAELLRSDPDRASERVQSPTRRERCCARRGCPSARRCASLASATADACAASRPRKSAASTHGPSLWSVGCSHLYVGFKLVTLVDRVRRAAGGRVEQARGRRRVARPHVPRALRGRHVAHRALPLSPPVAAA